jgi:hypothetical protein
MLPTIASIVNRKDCYCCSVDGVKKYFRFRLFYPLKMGEFSEFACAVF